MASEGVEPGEEIVMFVHPEDVDLPHIKAEAAQRGVSVVANPIVRRGTAYIARRDTHLA